MEELRHNPDSEGREAKSPGPLLPPHLTSLSGSEDIEAAPPPVHRGGTGYSPLPAWLKQRHSTTSALLPISARGTPLAKMPPHRDDRPLPTPTEFIKMACGIPLRQQGLVPLPAALLAFPPGAGGVPQGSIIS